MLSDVHTAAACAPSMFLLTFCRTVSKCSLDAKVCWQFYMNIKPSSGMWHADLQGLPALLLARRMCRTQI